MPDCPDLVSACIDVSSQPEAVWRIFRARAPRLAPFRAQSVIFNRSESKGVSPAPRTRLPTLPAARIVDATKLQMYNGVPFILGVLHDVSKGVELRGNAVDKPTGPDAKSLPHTHQHKTRAQDRKSKQKGPPPIVEYVPDVRDPYCPNIDWPKSSGKHAGREYYSAKPRKPKWADRLKRTLEAIAAPTTASIAELEDDGHIDMLEERAGREKKQPALRPPPGSWQCGWCQDRFDSSKALNNHLTSRHRDRCLQQGNSLTTTNGAVHLGVQTGVPHLLPSDG